jgi:HSP20 family protein
MMPVLSNRGINWPEALDLVDREFGRLARRMWGNGNADLAAAYPADIWEDEDNVYVEAELPGFTKDQIEITLEQGTLQISATRQVEERKGEQYLNERRWTRSFRSFSLPTPVEEDRVQATVENGVLHLTLPKRAEVKPRKIRVS